jgi:hypothetical protein
VAQKTFTYLGIKCIKKHHNALKYGSLQMGKLILIGLAHGSSQLKWRVPSQTCALQGLVILQHFNNVFKVKC